MRNLLLSAVSAVALALSGAAVAVQANTETRLNTEAPTLDQAAAEQTIVQSQTTTDQPMTEGEGSAGQAPAVSPSDPETTAPMEQGDRFGSYEAAPESFTGEIAGGYLADELIGKSLVDANGDSVGEVNDLLVSQDNRVDKVLVDVGGFLGIGERRVALDINELTLAEDGRFVTNKTQEELETMPEYSRMDAEWTVMPTE